MLLGVIKDRKEGMSLKDIAAKYNIGVAVASRYCCEIANVRMKANSKPINPNRRKYTLPSPPKELPPIVYSEKTVDLNTILSEAKKRIENELAIVCQMWNDGKLK
jgi:hypothetical protein